MARLVNFFRRYHLRRFITLILPLLGVLLVYSLANQLHTLPLVSGELSVSQQGVFTQAGLVNGRFLQRGNDATVQLELSDPQYLRAMPVRLLVKFPESISIASVGVSFHSIQGTQGIYYRIVGPHSLEITTPELVPESHTVVRIDVPAEQVSLPATTLLLSQILFIPTLGWIGLALLFGLGCFIYSLFIIRQPKIGSAELKIQPPEGLKPVEVGVLYNHRLLPNHIAAILFDLAQRGYLEIVKNQETVLFIPKSEPRSYLKKYEEIILDLLTPKGNQPSTLQDIADSLDEETFSQAVSDVYIEVYNQLQERKYFLSSLRFLHLHYKTMAIIFQITGLSIVFLAYFLLYNRLFGVIYLGLAGYLSGFVFSWAAYRVNPLSNQGRTVFKELQGFVNYLADSSFESLTSQDRLNPYLNLPYALAVGRQGEWMNKFYCLTPSMPTWFASSDFDTVTLDRFVQSVGDIAVYFADLFVELKDPNVD